MLAKVHQHWQKFKRFPGNLNHRPATVYVIVDAPFALQFRKAYCGPLPPSYTVDEALTKLPPTKVTSLSNGMRVATEKTPGES